MNSTLSSNTQDQLDALLAQCKGVILDFDGLVADSEPFHFKAYNTVFQKYGHTLIEEEYWVEFTSKGKGIRGEIERYNLQLDVEPEDMRKEKFVIYSGFAERGEIPVFPDAKRFVTLLSERFKIAIASGSWEKDIRAILRNADMEPLVPVIFGKAPDKRREKPAPDIFLQTADALGLEPAQCLVVEDALKGVQAAKDAGMPSVVIRNPLNEGIEFPDASVIVPSLKALTDYLEQRS